MAPKRGKKYSNVTALPGGSELETLAWGYQMEQTAKWRGVAEEIQAFTNDASLGLLSGTGKAEWALYSSPLGVGVPISRAQALTLTPAETIKQHFDAAEAGRQRGPRREFNPEDGNHSTKALVKMTGGTGSKYGEVATTVGPGLAITKAQGLRAQLERAKTGASRPPAQIEDVPAPVAPRLADTDVDSIIGGIMGPPEAPLAQMSQPAQPGARSVLREDLTDLNEYLDDIYAGMEPPLHPFA